MSDAEKLRKKRSTIKGKITKLTHKIQELERDPDKPNLVQAADLFLEKAQGLERDFKTLHEEIIEGIDINEQDELASEQDILDRQDDVNEDLILRLRVLVMSKKGKSKDDLRRRLRRLRSSLQDAKDKLETLDGEPEQVSVVQQYAEELGLYKDDLRKIEDDLLLLDLEDDHELVNLHTALNELHFSCACATKSLLKRHNGMTVTKMTPSSKIVTKLPKLEVPTFSGEILKWRAFWDMFQVSIHNQESMSNPEKLLYLRQAVNSGPAGQVIEGLSHTGDQYDEAITCLKNRYDQPREVHEAYVRVIVEYPKMKDGLGKELRKLHDVMLQNLRALKTMGYHIDPQFMTSLIQLKLDSTTSFAWREASKDLTKKVPDCEEILKFLDQRARCADDEGSNKKSLPSATQVRKPFVPYVHKTVSTHISTNSTATSCCLCPKEKHPLYFCPKFKAMPVGEKRNALAEKNACFNCLRIGHKANQCQSLHRCKTCQKPHHTILHQQQGFSPIIEQQVTSNTATTLKVSSLLMTCKVVVSSPNGNSVEARAILDPGSTASFITERMASALRLPRSRQAVHISGITGAVTGAPMQMVASCTISPVFGDGKPMDMTAIVLPKVTRDMPIEQVPSQLSWTHLDSLNLADPTFGEPGKIDALLGIEVYVNMLRQGRRYGPPGTPTALETGFGWVLCGNVEGAKTAAQHCAQVTVHHLIATSTDDLLKRFWEVEEMPKSKADSTHTHNDKEVMAQFETTHRRTPEGRFVVELPRKQEFEPLGESRSQAVRRFQSLERSLHQRSRFQKVDEVIQEYISLGHAETVPDRDLKKNTQEVYYMPIHVVYKDSSTTTKVRAVFDASAKTSSGTSLNDTLMVGPTVHPQLVDVLLKFRMHRVALTTDISKMYRAVELAPSDKDYHRFVWREEPGRSLQDYRMTRVTFGVAASCFAANMAVQRNAQELSQQYPLAAKATQESFYVDDGLTGADTIEEALHLREQLQELFSKACFQLRKWNSSETQVLSSIHWTSEKQRRYYQLLTPTLE